MGVLLPPALLVHVLPVPILLIVDLACSPHRILVLLFWKRVLPGLPSSPLQYSQAVLSRRVIRRYAVLIVLLNPRLLNHCLFTRCLTIFVEFPEDGPAFRQYPGEATGLFAGIEWFSPKVMSVFFPGYEPLLRRAGLFIFLDHPP